MKVYVATKWEERDYAQAVMQRLIALGHTISYDWTVVEQISQTQADLDMAGVVSADALLFLAEKDLSYKGALAELGAALATKKRVILLGHGADNCIFTHHSGVERVATLKDAIVALNKP